MPFTPKDCKGKPFDSIILKLVDQEFTIACEKPTTPSSSMRDKRTRNALRCAHNKPKMLLNQKMNLSGSVNHGKVLTSAGQALLDSVANDVLEAAIERHPGLSNY